MVTAIILPIASPGDANNIFDPIIQAVTDFDHLSFLVAKVAQDGWRPYTGSPVDHEAVPLVLSHAKASRDLMSSFASSMVMTQRAGGGRYSSYTYNRIYSNDHVLSTPVISHTT